MREIKFRAWDTAKEKMFEVGTLGFIEGAKWSAYLLEDNFIDNKQTGFYADNINLLQFIGLKDKNGVEIYDFNIICAKFIVAKYKSYHYLIDISNGDILLNGIQNEKLEITGEYFSLSEDSKRNIDDYIQQAERTLSNKKNAFAVL